MLNRVVIIFLFPCFFLVSLVLCFFVSLFLMFLCFFVSIVSLFLCFYCLFVSLFLCFFVTLLIFLAIALVDFNPFLVIIMCPLSVASDGGKWFLMRSQSRPGNVLNWSGCRLRALLVVYLFWGCLAIGGGTSLTLLLTWLVLGWSRLRRFVGFVSSFVLVDWFGRVLHVPGSSLYWVPVCQWSEISLDIEWLGWPSSVLVYWG